MRGSKARAGPGTQGKGNPMSNPIAYSIKAAGRAFSPHLSERFMRRCIAQGIFKIVKLGHRTYLIHDELVEALRALGSEPK
jgi:hypothetical protein